MRISFFLRVTRRETLLRPLTALFFVLLFTFVPAAPGVIFLSTANPDYNTAAPSGELANSGWQYQGAWGIFSGTAIAPHLFITGSHVGGNVGESFFFQGAAYRTVATFKDPNSDLRIWRVCGELPISSPLYAGSDEIGKSFVVIGRGTQRGEPVSQNGELKGWLWGPADGRPRWGENSVRSIISDGAELDLNLGPIGNVLQARFERGKGANEADLSFGDSGGAIFINEGGVWKLAGINLAVEGPFNTNTIGPGFQAAIFDKGGLYTGGEGNWRQVLDLPIDQPGSFFATRISSNLAWINQVLNDASKSGSGLRVLASTTVNGPYLEQTAAVIDEGRRTITVPVGGDTQFFQLLGCEVFRITDASLAGTSLVLTFEVLAGASVPAR